MSACEDTAGVRMWLDIGPQVYDRTKNVLSKKDTEDKDDRSFRTSNKLRQKEIQEIDRKASKEHEEAKKNSNFTQTYPKGWQRIRELVRDKQGAAAIGLYSFFAEHIDPTCGAVVCDQQFLANQMGVSTRTIRRWLDYLEEKGALVRIPVAGKVCAYALDPHEVWKGYNTSKDYSAFVTKTLVNKDGEIKRRIMAMFSGEESGQEQ